MSSSSQFDAAITILKAKVASLSADLRAAEARIARLEEPAQTTLTTSAVNATARLHLRSEEVDETDPPSLIITDKDEFLLIQSFRKLKEEQRHIIRTSSSHINESDTQRRPKPEISCPGPELPQASSTSQQRSSRKPSSSQQQTLDPGASPFQPFLGKQHLVFGQPSTPYRRHRSLNFNVAASPFGNYVDEKSPFSQLEWQESLFTNPSVNGREIGPSPLERS
ncbi:hypothetical protein BDV96DRAFT_149282 [Lophiotrema nucula]|uniref:Uncharacterized protein n=1 Tax=Lophiotrema nucula TaxID=690887 RepID=A0A6A5Z0T3_9PLEO|nr:hypothetical protein BDV96DRAFT_149282 [Lophiotrema nucula]